MPRTIEDVARELATAHKQADPEMREVFLIADPGEAEVRLVEVSDSVGNTGSVMPFRFGARPDLDVPFPSVVILLSPEEKAALDRNDLKLPAAWGSAPELLKIA